MTAPKIALVTGATRGIGFEIARQLAQKGITVLLAGRNLTDATHAAAKIATDVMQVIPLKLDVTQQADITAATKFVEEKFGHLDILINNAGVLLEHQKGFTAATLRETLEINTIAPYALVQAFLPLLKKSAHGRIVNQSSILGSLQSCSDPNMVDGPWLLPAYSASKAALNMLTVTLARQLSDTPIKVNSAHPGWVRTAMGGDEADLSPQEGAKTAIRLALLSEDGPTGGFFHGEEHLPW